MNQKGKSKLKINVFYQSLYRVFTGITPLITSPYLSRVLGADKLGIFSSTYSYANYFLLMAMLGIETYGSREISSTSDSIEQLAKKFWSMYSIQLIASVISMIIYFWSIRFFPYENEKLYISYLQGIWIFAAMLDINWFFWGKEHFKITVTRNMIIKVLTIILILTLVKSKDDLPMYVLIMAGSQVVSQIVLWPFLKSILPFCKITFEEIYPHIKPLILLFIPIMATSVFHIMDKTMLGLLSTDNNSGYYYNVDRLANIPISVVTGLNTVMLPRLSHMQAIEGVGDKQIYQFLYKSYELTISWSSAIAFGLGAIAPIFVPCFFGKGYEPCVNLILLYMPILILKSTSSFICNQYLLPYKKEKIYMKAVLVATGFNFVCNYFLIKSYGAVGAALATLIAEGVVLAYEIICIRRQFCCWLLFKSNLNYILFGIGMFFIVRYSYKIMKIGYLYQLIVSIVLGMIVYMLLCTIWAYVHSESIYHNFLKLRRDIYV